MLLQKMSEMSHGKGVEHFKYLGYFVKEKDGFDEDVKYMCDYLFVNDELAICMQV